MPRAERLVQIRPLRQRKNTRGVTLEELRAFLSLVILQPARPNNFFNWLRSKFGERNHATGPAVITQREPHPVAKPNGK